MPHHFVIKEPIWKTRSIGLDREKIEKNSTVEITYKDKKGERLYPWIYEIPEVIDHYPTQIVKGHVLYIIPIIDLIPKKRIGD